MPLLYRRKIVVDIVGLTITEPRITIEFDRQIDRSQDKGQVRVFNLTPEHAQRIEKRGERITIRTGTPSPRTTPSAYPRHCGSTMAASRASWPAGVADLRLWGNGNVQVVTR